MFSFPKQKYHIFVTENSEIWRSKKGIFDEK